MKSVKIILFLLCFFSLQGYAQRDFGGGKREKIKAMKIAFITNEIGLTPDEATKFWPVYNAFDAKQTQIRIQKAKAFLDRFDEDALNKMNDKEASNLLAQMEKNEDDLYQNKKQFTANLKGILPAIKIIKLKKAEDNFNKKLLQQFKNKMRD